VSFPCGMTGVCKKKTPFTNKLRTTLAQTHLPSKLRKSADSFTLAGRLVRHARGFYLKIVADAATIKLLEDIRSNFTELPAAELRAKGTARVLSLFLGG